MKIVDVAKLGLSAVLVGLCFVAFCVFCNTSFGGRERFISAETTTESVAIGSVQDFINQIAISRQDNSYLAGKSFYLTADLDFSETSFGDYGNRRFKGVFDGNGHTINGVKFNAVEGYTGFFSTLNGTVCNLNIYASCADENFSYTGGAQLAVIAGKASSGAVIENCYINANFTSLDNKDVSLYAITACAMSNAKFDNLYIESDSSILLFNAYTTEDNKKYTRGEESITAILHNNVSATTNLGTMNISTPTISAEGYWKQDASGNAILKIMDTATKTETGTDTETGGETGKTEETGESGESGETGESGTETGESEGKTGETETESEGQESTKAEPIYLTPLLKESQFTYSGVMPNLEIDFLGVESGEEISYTLNYGETDTTQWNVGTYTATIELGDTNKYVLKNSAVTFTIVPYPIKITWIGKQFTFNAHAQMPTYTAVTGEFNPKISFEEEFVSAGKHTAKLCVSDNFALDNPTCEYEILQYVVPITWTNTELTYNTQSQIPTAHYVENEITAGFEFEYFGYQTNASKEYYYASIILKDKNGNYALDDSAQCAFVINAYEVNVTWGEKTVFEYNAQKQVPYYQITKPDFIGEDNFYESLSGNATEVATYTIKIMSSDSVNFCVKNFKKEFEIIKYKLQIDWGDTTLIYNGKKQMPKFSYTLPSFCDYALDIKCWNLATTVGENYSATISVEDKYITIYNPCCNFKIVPYTLEVAWDNCVVTYNGEEQKPEVQTTNLDFGEVTLAVSGGQVNQGRYTATVSIVSDNKANFTFAKDTTEFIILPYTINVEWDNSEIFYDGKPHAPRVINWPDIAKNMSIIYSDTAVDVGSSYKTQISLKNDDLKNFILKNNECEFKITSAPVVVSWGEKSFVYDSEEKFPQFSLDKTFATQYSLKNIGKNAGNYTAEIVSENNNYYFINSTCDYVIEKYGIDVFWQDTKLIYNTYPQKPTVKYSEIAFCKNLEIIVSGEGKDVGKYLATAEVDSLNSGNFCVNNSTQEFTITKRIISINWLKTTAEYDETFHSPEFELSENFSDLEVRCESFKTCGEYPITPTCDSKNYSLSYTAILFTITQKQVEVEWGNCEFVYDNTFHCPTATYQGKVLKTTGAQINADTHIATCESWDSNYKITNSEQEFVIKPYEILVSWSDEKLVFNGTTQTPTAIFSTPDFASNVEFKVCGGQIKAGEGYEAKVVCNSSNYMLAGEITKTFAILPYSVAISWKLDEVNLIYNGQTQYPSFEYTKSAVAGDLDIIAHNAGKDCGEYKVTLQSRDSNFVLTNNTCSYSISPYKITLAWEELDFVYNAKQQKPQCTAKLPRFATDLKIATTPGEINAGVYMVTATIDSMNDDADNFELINNTKEFEILPYALVVEWSDIDAVYSGEMHTPTAIFTADCDFDLPQISVSGGAVLVGTHTAIASIDDPNFTISNTECVFSITPQAVKCECEQAVIQVSASNEQVVGKIDIKNVAKNDLVLPAGHNFIFGFEITAVLKSALPKTSGNAVGFNATTNADTTAEKYLITLYLSSEFVMPDNAILYLYSDSVCTPLNYEIEDNTITFETAQLGTVFLATTQYNPALLPLAITFGCLSAVLLAFLVFGIVRFKNRKKSPKSPNN